MHCELRNCFSIVFQLWKCKLMKWYAVALVFRAKKYDSQCIFEGTLVKKILCRHQWNGQSCKWSRLHNNSEHCNSCKSRVPRSGWGRRAFLHRHCCRDNSGHTGRDHCNYLCPCCPCNPEEASCKTRDKNGSTYPYNFNWSYGNMSVFYFLFSWYFFGLVLVRMTILSFFLLFH